MSLSAWHHRLSAACRSEKKERVDSIINALGLGKVRGTLVGGGMRRGVSGGERKRVSVAHELLIDPAVLILDGVLSVVLCICCVPCLLLVLPAMAA